MVIAKSENKPGLPRNVNLAIFADERSIHTRRWVLGLRGRGHRVDLITLRKSRESDIGGIDLGARSKAGYLAKIDRLKKTVKSLNPDILHTHYMSSYGFLASFVNHPRKVLSVWGNDLTEFPNRNAIFRAMARRSLSRVHRITVTSEYLKAAVYAFQGDLVPVNVVPFGVDVNQFAYVERSAGKEIRIGIAKHLNYQYGIDVLIKAVEILVKKQDDIRLIIAGTGPKEKEYKRLAGRLGVSDYIEFIGHVDHRKMPEFLKSLDIFAMPSSSDDESFGVAALEASATGLPLVGTTAGGIPEVIAHGVTGFLAEKKNPHQLADYIEILIKDRELRWRMGKAGRKFVEERYLWSDNLQDMEKIYMDITNS